MVPKGSVAIEGISLTIADWNGEDITIAILPLTYWRTNLHTLAPGAPVNVEADVLVKLAYAQMQEQTKPSFDLTEACGWWRTVLMFAMLHYDQSIDWSKSMRSIQASEAKTHFLRLLDEVERGESLTITRHGKPVARVIPEIAFDNVRKTLAAASILAIRERTKPVSLQEILSARDEGRM